MIDQERIRKTERFLQEKYDRSVFLNANPEAKAYRIEHSCRVANLARQIARAEGFDETESVIAGLLHDIAYCEEFGEDGWIEHGRRSAAIARPFLEGLGMREDRIRDICFGIAIHVDDRADFEGERTPFALTVGDADNLDRFDVYRIHEGLAADGFLDKPLDGKCEYVQARLKRFGELSGMPFATDTAASLWRSRISFCIAFYERLRDQLQASRNVLDR